MKNLSLLLLIWVYAININQALSQSPCTVQSFASPVQISCGDSVTLSAFGQSTGNIAFQENFNLGTPVGWEFTQTVTIAANTCGVPSPDGTPFMWMGDQSVNPRDMVTVPFDLTLGGVICFEMRYAVQGDDSPCEGPDLASEGVYVQYSTDGINWVTIEYWNPNGGYDAQLTAWNQYCVAIPPGAQTASTRIRWHQAEVSGAQYDHWGIDNVIITLNDPNFQITWMHDGYSYGFGSPGGDNPNIVSPQTTTSYNVIMTDGVESCSSTVVVEVIDPIIAIEMIADTTLCPGECVNLDATAKWEVVAPGPRTFINDLTQSITAGLAGGSDIDIPIGVTGLNFSQITDGSILEVCITSMDFFGQNFFPTPGIITIGLFQIVLTCPSGQSITLVPSGVTTSTLALPGYVNTCFTMTAANPINAGTPPYTGNWLPANPFSQLTGCDAEGEWTLSMIPSQQITVGSGTFQGWSITFDDPGVYVDAIFEWSPTTNMTNANTLDPTVCPTQTTTYTLTANSVAGCNPTSQSVTITVPNECCALIFESVNIQNPSCVANNGSISINVSGQTTGLQYSINNGQTFQTSNVFNNLAAGTYVIVVNDDEDCPISQTVVLEVPVGPEIEINVTPASCGINDGVIIINALTGNPPYLYSANGGTTAQSSNTFTGLAQGIYNIVVIDANGCSTTATANITNPNAPIINSVDIQITSCIANDGSIAISASGGNPPYQYSNNNGQTFQASNTFVNLASGNYIIVVVDADNCSSSQTVTVGSPENPTVVIVTTPTECGLSTGSASTQVTGGQAPFSYNWSSGSTAATAESLPQGLISVTVTDNLGCEGTATANVSVESGSQILEFEVQTTPESCLGNDGTATVEIINGFPPYTYLWNTPVSSNLPNVFGLAAGVYSVTVTDLCSTDSLSFIVESDISVPDIETVPNIITPNNDGVNDIYTTGNLFESTLSFNCKIYNRWGRLVFETENKNIDWTPVEGTSDGVYFLIINYEDCTGTFNELTSTVTITK